MPPTPRPPHPLATVEQIVSNPSAQDGIPADVESDLRVAGCMMIQEAGILLELPQSTMATAQVIFHRFFYVSSMLSFGVNDLSVSALYLATKLNETPVRMRDLINTYMYLHARIKHLLAQPAGAPLSQLAGSSRSGSDKGKQRAEVWDGFAFSVPSFHSTVFWEWKEAIQYNESQLLKRLGFNMQVDLPYSHVINYLRILDLVFEKGVAQLCWSILNDALLTPLYAQQPTHVLAVMSILLATRLRRIPLPEGWYLLFDVTWDDIWPCCGTVMQLWRDWGLGDYSDDSNGSGNTDTNEDEQRAKEDRWRRAG
ncbi:uncharacterized protein EHS24_002317 [Apiotrichum porosum]|uniref:Cyclin N-terminal domain-containing protein n=1 Tax=Apiotrichum porosum TaxID=105984 RepID=A0A427XI58_9TREE|nr:uncharacterized protein EHS24_002317 [Apiotrichum porosum]RSH78589.1 hypothetical protein EHS24_002317 [Apiotrichum porosum]